MNARGGKSGLELLSILESSSSGHKSLIRNDISADQSAGIDVLTNHITFKT